MTEKVDIEEGYDIWSETYDDTPNSVLETEGDIPLKMLGDIEDKKILDAGCGTGRWSIILAEKGAEVYGIDFSEGMLSEAKEKADERNLEIDFMQQDLTEKLPFENSFFDDILCSTAIESIQDIQPVFREFARVLKEGGTLILTTIQPLIRERENPSFEVDNEKYEIPDEANHFLEDYFRLLKENGFEIEDIREPKEEGTDYPLLLIIKARKIG